MGITILDLINTKKIDGMKLIAGKAGLNRRVSGCGILDYELDQVLKDRYLHKNFREDQFVLTTFLYAKDDPHLIADAIKYLVEKKVSCLAIKNIYNLPIQTYILRYADSKNFPVFIIQDPFLYFEDIIISINNSIKKMDNFRYGQVEIDSILNKNLDRNSIKEYVYELNPSFLNHYVCFCFDFEETLTFERFDRLLRLLKNNGFDTPLISIFRFRNALMMIYSTDYINQDKLDILAGEIKKILGESKEKLWIGVSEIHHHLHEFKEALNESIYSSLLNRNSPSGFSYYKDIGSYQAIFPYVESSENKQILAYSKRILNPILDYDAVNKLKLSWTLIEYINSNGNLLETAKKLSLHENTIRNRLEKIQSITGLNFSRASDYEELSLAVKIYNCQNLLNDFL